MKRPKLSLEPDHQVRREPPQGFTSLEGTAPDAAQGPSDATGPSKAPDPRDDGPSEATGSAPAREPDVLSTRPPPSPSPTAPRPAQSAAQPPPRKVRFDGATIGKILLAVGVAALSILLLKRRFL